MRNIAPRKRRKEKDSPGCHADRCPSPCDNSHLCFCVLLSRVGDRHLSIATADSRDPVVDAICILVSVKSSFPLFPSDPICNSQTQCILRPAHRRPTFQLFFLRNRIGRRGSTTKRKTAVPLIGAIVHILLIPTLIKEKRRRFTSVLAIIIKKTKQYARAWRPRGRHHLIRLSERSGRDFLSNFHSAAHIKMTLN